MGYGICPNCDKKVIFEKEPEIGIHVLCETCQTELVITWLNPIELALIDYEEYETDGESEIIEDFEEYENEGIYADEPEVETFQKIKRKNRGGYNGNGQTQKKQ